MPGKVAQVVWNLNYGRHVEWLIERYHSSDGQCEPQCFQSEKADLDVIHILIGQ